MVVSTRLNKYIMSLGFTIPGKSKTHTQHPRQGHMPTHGRVFVTCFVKEKQCWHVFATFGAEGVRASTTKRYFNDFKDIDAKVRHLFFKCNHVGTATDTLCLRTVHSQTLCTNTLLLSVLHLGPKQCLQLIHTRPPDPLFCELLSYVSQRFMLCSCAMPCSQDYAKDMWLKVLCA